MTQLGIFEVAERKAKEARLEAFDRIQGHSETLREAVLDAIRKTRGMTCDEVEVALCMTHQTASARVHELMRAGRIAFGGKRKTRSGRNATVWVAL